MLSRITYQKNKLLFLALAMKTSCGCKIGGSHKATEQPPSSAAYSHGCHEMHTHTQAKTPLEFPDLPEQKCFTFSGKDGSNNMNHSKPSIKERTNPLPSGLAEVPVTAEGQQVHTDIIVPKAQNAQVSGLLARSPSQVR